ncbi:MAG TPA: 50S ribosomal protein L22 [Methanomassiliicoccales archaeon]|jgi:large subunit ribosomal protein L22|nr:50S ribosomal protein L22 [Methanomassiliicoccales archaeon]MCE5261076.1 50S ribosomal protein L22 [Euryarchaeota archaeon]HOE52794.1 50S ribosomal protein L22 [Methanomassiliicoccales archaeon]HOO03172.1 50S ribosomal protein L22 [Methanomassiliicoccales archaeon]HQM66254.1 50S ribosomal protein L22 [Methanomassiliicoccales archaeon]
MVGYTAQADPDTTSRAIAKELPISPKFSREICRMVRGKKVDDAIRMLEEVVELRRPVPIRRYNYGVAHKPGIGPGRYPTKAAAAIIKVLESAKSNAEYKGLDTDNMRVRVISAHLGRTIPGYMPRAHGRSTAWDQQTVNIEVILEEAQ